MMQTDVEPLKAKEDETKETDTCCHLDAYGGHNYGTVTELSLFH